MRRVVLLPLAALLLGACGGEDPAPRAATPAPTATPTVEVPDDCGGTRPAKPVKRPKGLLGPRSVEVELAESLPPNMKVEGYVPLTPAQFAAGVERRDEYKVLFTEAEANESEVMFTDGRHRNFWKVVQACEDGSKFTALVGKEP